MTPRHTVACRLLQSRVLISFVSAVFSGGPRSATLFLSLLALAPYVRLRQSCIANDAKADYFFLLFQCCSLTISAVETTRRQITASV
jgi:hypothetical protein